MNFKQRTGTCDEATFWECVAEIDWPNNSDYHLTKPALLRAWTPEFTASFREILDVKVSHVHTIFEAAEKELSQKDREAYYLGDDGFGDFCNHVVGLGWKTFESETKDVSKLFVRARRCDYVECFSYSIPYEPTTTRSFEDWCKKMGYSLEERDFDARRDDGKTFEEYLSNVREDWENCRKGDWRYIETDHYAKLARGKLAATQSFLDALEHQNPLSDDERHAVEYAQTLKHYLRLLIDEKTGDALSESEKALEAWWGLFHIAKDLRGLRGMHAYSLPMIYGYPHSGENLINDHRNYMGNLPEFRCEHHLRIFREAAKRDS